jgi:hypothetical protein
LASRFRHLLNAENARCPGQIFLHNRAGVVVLLVREDTVVGRLHEHTQLVLVDQLLDVLRCERNSTLPLAPATRTLQRRLGRRTGAGVPDFSEEANAPVSAQCHARRSQEEREDFFDWLHLKSDFQK